jgi:hypothetical protein
VTADSALPIADASLMATSDGCEVKVLRITVVFASKLPTATAATDPSANHAAPAVTPSIWLSDRGCPALAALASANSDAPTSSAQNLLFIRNTPSDICVGCWRMSTLRKRKDPFRLPQGMPTFEGKL